MNLEVNRLLETNEPLRCAGNALSDLVEEATDQMLLKDAQTGKYILSSPVTPALLGVSINDFIGLTIADLAAQDGIWSKWNLSPNFLSWKDKEPEVIKNLDRQVEVTQQPVSLSRVTFTSEGFIRFKETIKKPVFSCDSKKVIGIINFSKNLTVQKSLPDLLKLYQTYYSEQEAIQKLLMYLEIDGYFNALPALDEVQILFSIQQFSQFSGIENSKYLSLKNKVDAELWREMLTRLHAIPANITTVNAK